VRLKRHGSLKKVGIPLHLIGPGGLQIETHGQQVGSTGSKWAAQIKLVQVKQVKPMSITRELLGQIGMK